MMEKAKYKLDENGTPVLEIEKPKETKLKGKPPTSQTQIVRQSSLNRAVDLVCSSMKYDEGDIEKILEVAGKFEKWVKRYE